MWRRHSQLSQVAEGAPLLRQTAHQLVVAQVTAGSHKVGGEGVVEQGESFTQLETE